MEDEVPGEWIGKLFPPAYSYTTEDVLAGIPEDDPVKSKIKRVAAFDPEAIQQVYEKVRVMNILDAEMKQQTRERLRQQLSAHEGNKETQPGNKAQTVATELRTAVTDRPGTADRPVDLKDSCVWDSEELGVLRDVYKSAKVRIQDLEVEVAQTKKRCSLIAQENDELQRDLEQTEHSLREARKANKRFQIQCKNIKEQFDFTSAKLDAVTEMWKEISEEKSAMLKESQELRIQADQERLRRKRLEMVVEEKGREVEVEKQLAQQYAQIKYETIIMDLHERVEKLSDELVKEKQSHGITRKAVNSLRNHFASLPLRDILPNAVLEDQVANVDYLSL